MTLENTIGVFGVLVNIAGFLFVIRQLRMQALATRGETYTSLCGLSYDILQLITDRTFLYDYIYQGKRLAATTPEDERVTVLITCEMIANYCDNVALQRENIPDEVWQRWRTFIHEQIVCSAELNRFMRQYINWYSPALASILLEIPAATD